MIEFLSMILILFWWAAAVTVLLPVTLCFLLSKTIVSKWQTFLFGNLGFLFQPAMTSLRKKAFQILKDSLQDSSPNGLQDNSPNGQQDSLANRIQGSSANGIQDNSPYGLQDNSPYGLQDSLPSRVQVSSPNEVQDSLPNDSPDHLPEGLTFKSPVDSPDNSSNNSPDGITYRSPKGLRDCSPIRTSPLEILEIGVGDGANLPFYPENSRLTVLDVNAYFESYFWSNAKRWGQVEYKGTIIAGAEDMREVKDCSLDVVVGTYVLCSCDDPVQVLKEIKRVLKPGGKYLFLEHIRFPEKGWSQWLQKIARPLWKLYFNGCVLDRDSDKSIRKAGFSELKYEPATISGLFGYPYSPQIIGMAVK